jgi:formylglycine-generating enzyme required for sulfatase activity
MPKSTPPNKEAFNTIKNLLLPHLENTTERSAFVRSALYGCRVVNQIDWSGSGAVFTANLIHKLLDFGECEEGHPAIVLLLEELKLATGVDKHNQIDALIEVFLPHLISIDSMPKFMPIPAGEVTLEGREGSYLKQEQVEKVPEFEISKYPITNSQYEKFFEADGYKQKRWWTEKGWKTREEKKWLKSRVWGHKRWSEPNYPVVGVSWYEAIAFCRWLSDATGEMISLPTEKQWQHAAQGDEKRRYPWGNVWDADRCNTDESNLNHITFVHKYQHEGDSPYQITDLIGNVWEWCLTDYMTGSNIIDDNEQPRVMRGGSFIDKNDYANCVCRSSSHPAYRLNNYGFRIVRLY